MEFCKVTLCDHSNESSLPVLTHGAICFSTFAQNEIWTFGQNFLLAKFGSERVKEKKALLSQLTC